MLKNLFRIAVALLACAATISLAAPAQAGHDSNTLSKIGKAIQYPIRKNTSNLSVDVHRAEGRKSVVHRRNGDKTYRAIITPKGSVHRIYRVGPHGRRARRHYNRTHKH